MFKTVVSVNTGVLWISSVKHFFKSLHSFLLFCRASYGLHWRPRAEELPEEETAQKKAEGKEGKGESFRLLLGQIGC